MTERNALNDRPTPETDAHTRMPTELINVRRFDALYELARRLEQERDAAVEALEKCLRGPGYIDYQEECEKVLRAIKEGK